MQEVHEESFDEDLGNELAHFLGLTSPTRQNLVGKLLRPGNQEAAESQTFLKDLDKPTTIRVRQ